MILQSIGWPDRVEDLELFYRSDASVELDARAGEFHLEGQSIRFDTYFNDFSIGKWRMYTCLDNLKLHLELKGSFVVRLMHKYIMNTEYFSNTFAEQVCRCDERQAFEFVIPCDAWDRGMVCFSLEALECADNVCYGGWYETDVAGIWTCSSPTTARRWTRRSS